MKLEFIIVITLTWINFNVVDSAGPFFWPMRPQFRLLPPYNSHADPPATRRVVTNTRTNSEPTQRHNSQSDRVNPVGDRDSQQRLSLDTSRDTHDLTQRHGLHGSRLTSRLTSHTSVQSPRHSPLPIPIPFPFASPFDSEEDFPLPERKQRPRVQQEDDLSKTEKQFRKNCTCNHQFSKYYYRGSGTSFSCDKCDRKELQHEIFYGCGECDIDLCMECMPPIQCNVDGCMGKLKIFKINETNTNDAPHCQTCDSGLGILQCENNQSSHGKKCHTNFFICTC